MNRLKFMGIIAIVGLLFMPAAVISAPAGPPGGLAVQIINTTPVMVSGEVALTNTVEDPLPVEGSLHRNVNRKMTPHDNPILTPS